MSGPRLSQSAEAARSAAEQAEWNAKKWVWVPDIKEGYIAGCVNNEDEESAEVVLDSGRQIRRVRFEELFKMNPPKFDRVEDIADLTFLNEASVVHNLRLRYGSGAIYTYSGLFLVAINPYQSLPLYSDAIIQQYRGKRRDENPPHIFAVAERAWVNMGDERENQSILITGESGAGKTESTKKVIQYLAAIATDVHPPGTPGHLRSNALAFNQPPSGLRRTPSRSKGHVLSPSMSGSGSHLTARGRLGLLERQILQANPILEAFGNAQTQRNNNSSRFGKFVRIMFAPDGSIAGANIDWYLLEKSRVVYRNEAERSFHVFYQLLVGGADLKEELLLDGGVADYEFLNKSRREIDGVDDEEEWNNLKSALETVGFDSYEQFDLFRIVAAILHIGNIVLTSRSEDASMPDSSQAERVCHLLGIPIAEFTRALLRPQALAGREWVTQARTRQQAMDELGALCKTLYEKSFGALVERINRALDRPSSKSTFIGVLDIAGFEIFEVNGYEQLLINYTNEKLQQFFNHHMFVLEQEEYARENIHWDYVNFGLDLQPTIDLIEVSGPVIGILSCLDEECIMPKADDKTFTTKLNAMWTATQDEESHPGKVKYEPSRFEQGFVIQHYAAKVEYRTDGWLEKNKDPLNDNLTRVLAASSERYVAGLFADYADIPPGSAPRTNAFSVAKKRSMKRGAFRTVAQRHKEQLASLMTQLRSTQPHFVRCIVPNILKKPGRMDVPLVLDQLRCNGVLEGIRIARLGYPNRLPFVEFRQRYEILTPGILPKGYMDGREACRRMVQVLELDDTTFKLGTSKIFFKAGVLAELEESRDALLFDIFSRLQAVARMWTGRRQMKKILNRAVAIRVLQRNARVYGELREWPWWQLYTKVRPLLAATRNDEELRRKEMELALVRERAERDKQEREALEKLKMTLETEKRKVEHDLQAERALALDKDALLERSKQREVDLEEEVNALQLDINTLDSQLSRAMRLQRESEEKYDGLRQAFDQAAEHLVRMERKEREMDALELELNEQLRRAQDQISALHSDIDQLRKTSKNLEDTVFQREETLARAKEREENAIIELRGKLRVEIDNKNLIKEQADQIDKEARHTKGQLSELTRTAADYSTMIMKKEEQIAILQQQLHDLQAEYDKACLETMALRADIDTLDAQLTAEREDHAANVTTRNKLVEERDELRILLATKTSEETRRSEAQRSMEFELAGLRSEASKLHQDLTDLKRSSLENQNKAKLEFEQIMRDHSSLQSTHASLVEREEAAQAQLKIVQVQLPELEKAKRTLESELLSSRSCLHEQEDHLAEALRAKGSLERQLVAAQDKYRNVEDVVLELQQEKDTRSRELQAVREQLQTENSKRTLLEKSSSSQKAEIVKLKDSVIKFDKELNKALKDVKDREWEVRQLESKQDKTIVEHVHVLEEAKRVTDRLLVEAQAEIEKKNTYIRSLQMAKSKMHGESEDLAIKYSRELRNKEHEIKDQEKRIAEVLLSIEKERKAKEAAELHIHRVQTELQQARQQAEDFSGRLMAAERSRKVLDDELDRLVHETEGSDSLAKIQRAYESQVSQLQSQLNESETAKALRTSQETLHHQHARLHDLAQANKLLRQEITKLKDQQEVLQNEATNAKRELVQESERKVSATSAAQSELRSIIETLQANEQILQTRYENAEMERVRAVGAEHQALRQLGETERALKKAAEDHKKSLKLTERRIKDLEALIEQEGRTSSETGLLQRRIAEELENEREQHRKDLSERDLMFEQTRKTHQAEILKQSEELQTYRDSVSRVREENRQLRSDFNNLQVAYDDEVYNSSGWRNERERLETKIADLEKAYAASTGAQTEQQSQLVVLHSHVRELRGVLDDAEAERALLQKARRALQAELEAIKLDPLDNSHSSTEQEFQKLQLRKQDLERLLEEQEGRVVDAKERMKKAESVANDCQIELGKVRVENSQLDKVNARLEKQIKDLNGRIVDLETRSFSSRTTQSVDIGAEGLTDRLQRVSKDRRESSRLHRDVKASPVEDKRTRIKSEVYEAQANGTRQSSDPTSSRATQGRKKIG